MRKIALVFLMLAACLYATDYRYVTADADGSGDGTSSTTPWTFTQAVSGATGDMVVYIQSGTYSRSSTSDAPTGDGTAVNALYWIGCKTDWTPITPVSSVSTGLLDTTDYPEIAYTSGRLNFTGCDYAVVRCIKVTCSGYNGAALVSSPYGVIDSCIAIHSGTRASAAALSSNTSSSLINCNAALTGASGGNAAIDCSSRGSTLYGCTVYQSQANGISATTASSTIMISNCLVYGVSGSCLEYVSTSNWSVAWCMNSTLYGGTYGIKFTTSNQVTQPTHLIGNAIFGQSVAPIYSGCTDGFPTWLRFNGFDNTSFSFGGTWDLFYSSYGNNTITNSSPTDVIFKAPSTGDFRLRNNSPLIGSSYTAYNDIGYMQTGNMPSVGNVYAVTVNGETGTLTLPTVAQVLYDVLYGPGGDSFAGSYHSPAVADVKDGVLYGPDNTYEGEYVGSGGGGGLRGGANKRGGKQ